jgi:hypothetical protein
MKERGDGFILGGHFLAKANLHFPIGALTLQIFLSSEKMTKKII